MMHGGIPCIIKFLMRNICYYAMIKLNSNIRMHIANNSIWLFSDKLLNLMWG